VPATTVDDSVVSTQTSDAPTTASTFPPRWADGVGSNLLTGSPVAMICIELRGLQAMANNYDTRVVMVMLDRINELLRPLQRHDSEVWRLDNSNVLILLAIPSEVVATFEAHRLVTGIRSIRIPGSILAEIAATAVVHVSNGGRVPVETLRSAVAHVSGLDLVGRLGPVLTGMIPGQRRPS
jgi:hypothetical protein